VPACPHYQASQKGAASSWGRDNYIIDLSWFLALDATTSGRDNLAADPIPPETSDKLGRDLLYLVSVLFAQLAPARDCGRGFRIGASVFDLSVAHGDILSFVNKRKRPPKRRPVTMVMMLC
jgi:hypothetical protein